MAAVPSPDALHQIEKNKITAHWHVNIMGERQDIRGVQKM
jgi:hypothetical protein